MAASALPTLSQIQAFETDHLGAAATHWSRIAERWEDSFVKLALHMAFPGGDPWRGDAADAAQQRADTDLSEVRTVTDELRGAASVARLGEADLDTAKRAVLSAVADAEANGFTVGGDLSVTGRTAGLPPALQAARGAQAQAFAVQIRAGAAQLTALDQKVAAEIGSATGGIGTLGFPEGPTVPGTERGDIRLVDNHTFPQRPTPSPVPDPGTGGSPDPAGTLGLPRYNPGSLSNEEARAVYAQGELRMGQLDDQLARQGVSLEERAKTLSAQRNALRSWVRDIMADRGAAAGLADADPNLTWEQVMAKYQAQGLTGDDLYRKIIERSVASRPGVNDALGIDPKNPPPLPPVRPSAPIEAPAPARVEPPAPAPAPVEPPAPAPAPVEPPAPAPRLPEPPPPKPALPKPPVEGPGGFPPLGAGPPFGPHVIHPKHSIHHLPILGEDDIDDWEAYDP
jgi:hypothetical protein